MGAGGNFWDLLKPHARLEGFDFLRDKRVAVDLSYFIVQSETAIKGNFRNPHIRSIFFQTINLFSKFGTFPVFVTDGTPSPLKSQARIARFYRASGVDVSSRPVVVEGISVQRNKFFLKCVRECVDLLELLGMPVLNAKGEAEALCAQLNREGLVDACLTADSDAFLFGANCVIKRIHPKSKDPFECYHMSDIEAGLGLTRKHLIGISILVGNDHNLSGVRGIGLETAYQFVKSFSEDEILERLLKISRGGIVKLNGIAGGEGDVITTSDDNPRKPKLTHCSLCGHPGSKRTHLKSACELCRKKAGEGCKKKDSDFKCNCSSCNMDRKEDEQRKYENWHIKVCRQIASEEFPHDLIINMYLHNENRLDEDREKISWTDPKTEMLVEYLARLQGWKPSDTRRRMLPMLSTLFLRDVASNSESLLLYGQYEFAHIKRVKTRYDHQFYVVYWKKATNTVFADTDDTVTSRRPNMHQDNTTSNEFMEVPPDRMEVHIKKTGRANEVIDLTEDPAEDIHTVMSEEPNMYQENMTSNGVKYLTNDHPDRTKVHIKRTGRADEIIDLTEEPVDDIQTLTLEKPNMLLETWRAIDESKYLTQEGDDVLDIATKEGGKDEEVNDLTEGFNGPEIHREDGCCYLSTDEDIELVRKSFPEKVNQFLKQRESIRKRRQGSSGSSGGSGVQPSIDSFFRSSKGNTTCHTKLEGGGNPAVSSSSGSSASKKEQQKEENLSNFRKPVRRKLVFE
ncbi:unnamed protein product [Cuscuta europaea]|uniref:Flap endonuclease GEN-like 1 n=1 Tax=Cuscuta europaea TaxID=41803 RepID=A0A9P0ZZJ7_CUSEU|nr:unnamed protein product [Cuscuta europaea]